MEYWIELDEFPNYQVSNLGRVKKKECTIIYSNGIKCNYKEKILKPDLVKGYFRVSLSKDNFQKRFLVHRLVAKYFLENKLNKPCVNHIDGNKMNNVVDNLEWCTYSENERHSYKVLNKVNNNRKLTINQVLDIKENCVKNKNTKHFMDRYNVSRNTILNVLNNKTYD